VALDSTVLHGAARSARWMAKLGRVVQLTKVCIALALAALCCAVLCCAALCCAVLSCAALC